MSNVFVIEPCETVGWTPDAPESNVSNVYVGIGYSLKMPVDPHVRITSAPDGVNDNAPPPDTVSR